VSELQTFKVLPASSLRCRNTALLIPCNHTIARHKRRSSMQLVKWCSCRSRDNSSRRSKRKQPLLTRTTGVAAKKRNASCVRRLTTDLLT